MVSNSTICLHRNESKKILSPKFPEEVPQMMHQDLKKHHNVESKMKFIAFPSFLSCLSFPSFPCSSEPSCICRTSRMTGSWLKPWSSSLVLSLRVPSSPVRCASPRRFSCIPLPGSWIFPPVRWAGFSPLCRLYRGLQTRPRDTKHEAQ